MIKKIGEADWPDTYTRWGWDNDRKAPRVTEDNLLFLAKRHNELVDAFNALVDYNPQNVKRD